MITKQTLKDSPLMRWTALSIVAFTMMAAYFMTDVMAPLKPLLEKELLWDSMEYGWFTSAYGWFNVFLLMLIFGGLILDKFGIRFTGKVATGLMVIGACMKYWAISHHFPEGAMVFGHKASLTYAALGYALFGVGAEVAGITVTKIIVKWFKGKEMATAMGVQVALARVGTLTALSVSAPFATLFITEDLSSRFAGHAASASVLLGCVLLCIGFVAFFIYTFMDRKLDRQTDEQAEKEESEFSWNDVLTILRNKGFWLIAILCVLFYSCVFPFLKYATDLMVNKFHVALKLAGLIPALLPFGTLILTPLFGGIFDKKGKGATIMIIGAVLLIFVHVLFSIPVFDNWLLAVILMIILGIAFSLVPSAMWPSVAKIIPEKQLGTAYSLIFYIQNIGLMGVPYLIGWVLETYCVTGKTDGVTSYNYTVPMMIFSSFAILSLVVALLLKRQNRISGYGLEEPNIQK